MRVLAHTAAVAKYLNTDYTDITDWHRFFMIVETCHGASQIRGYARPRTYDKEAKFSTSPKIFVQRAITEQAYLQDVINFLFLLLIDR